MKYKPVIKMILHTYDDEHHYNLSFNFNVIIIIERSIPVNLSIKIIVSNAKSK